MVVLKVCCVVVLRALCFGGVGSWCVAIVVLVVGVVGCSWCFGVLALCWCLFLECVVGSVVAVCWGGGCVNWLMQYGDVVVP